MEMRVEDPELRRARDVISCQVRAAGGRALLVGGSVRDALLGETAEDLDIEVFGLDPEVLRRLLSEHFKLDLVGQSFGVLKIRHLDIDVSIPRRESKRGLGHKGFEIHSEPTLTLAEAAERRDFTINAMAFDPLSGELLDPFGGRRDLEARTLRHVSEKFAEDPLRVLRGMHFAARFDLTAAPATIAICQGIEPEGLARERIFDEWRKLILLGRQIGKGLAFLCATGWVRYTPELEALIDCPQDPEWHPEGDVWTHTCHVMDAFAGERIGEPWEDLVVGFGALCHDLGKPATTTHDEDGRIRSKGHEEEGVAPTRSFLGRMSHQAQLVDDIDRLVRVARADHGGRPPKPFDGFPAGDWLLEQARALQIAAQKPQPIVMGRHLIDLGLKPGPHFKDLLEACLDAQLDGVFSDVDGGVEFARGLLE